MMYTKANWLFCLTLTCCALVAAEPLAAETDRPNVLFIAIDDLNDWVGVLGGHPQVQTPNIDRLAARGTLFTNAHCQSPLCNPSRASVLTGMRPSTTGVYALAPWFRTVEELEELVSLPQYFAQHGYRTFSTGKIWHGGQPPQADRDAESDHWGPAGGVGARLEEKLIPPTPEGNHPLMDWGPVPQRDEDRGDWQVATWAVEQLQNPPDEPFFLAVGFFLPHVPLYATQPWFDLYPEETLELPLVRDDDRDNTPDFSWYLHWRLPEPRLSWLQEHDQWKPMVRAYLATTTFMDSQVGRVLDALEESGLAEETIVVLWSDHGFHLGEKQITGKNTLWERSTRVPLIFAGPGVAAGARCVEPAELLDIYPTLIDLCGLASKEDLEGLSLLPQLQQANTPRDRPAITTHNKDNHAVRSRRWRYIRYADGSEELYDMRKDPHEWYNLADDPDYDEIRRLHASWLPEVNAHPVPGSAHRLLVEKDGTWYWEEEPIDPEARIE